MSLNVKKIRELTSATSASKNDLLPMARDTEGDTANITTPDAIIGNNKRNLYINPLRDGALVKDAKWRIEDTITDNEYMFPFDCKLIFAGITTSGGAVFSASSLWGLDVTPLDGVKTNLFDSKVLDGLKFFSVDDVDIADFTFVKGVPHTFSNTNAIPVPIIDLVIHLYFEEILP